MDNDTLFREILRGLNEEFYHQTVTTNQIENYISEKAGYNYKPVFDQYLRTVKIPTLEFNVKKKKVFYRWRNVVPGFNLPIVLHKDDNYLKIIPSEKWSKIKINESQKSLIDVPHIERMYYVKAQRPEGG